MSGGGGIWGDRGRCFAVTHFGRWTLTLAGILMVSAAFSTSCASRNVTGSDGSLPDAAAAPDACCCKDPGGDEDGDGIPNCVEGCCVDTDGDKTPNYVDFDSDDDGVYDALEAGGEGSCAITHAKGKGWPCDTDGDGAPDYLDKDSDGDGLNDDCEDLNGDGLLGCCIKSCSKPLGRQRSECLLTESGCGPGQSCTAGSCAPAALWGCSAGETDRIQQDTFADGRLDGSRGTSVCKAPKCGGTQISLQHGMSSAGDWRLALRPGATLTYLTLHQPDDKLAAATVDYRSSQTEVAGFVISREPAANTLADEAEAIRASLVKQLKGAPASTMRSSGSAGKSHDCYDQLRGVTLELVFSAGQDLSTLRNSMVTALVGQAILPGAPKPFGASTSQVIVRLTLIRRFEHKRDANGALLDEKGLRTTISGKCPADDGDATKRRLIVTGAVVDRARYRDPKQSTRLVADDLTDGTTIARRSMSLQRRCEAHKLADLPRADILWVIDEGLGSSHPSPWSSPGGQLFSRLLASGLDFRMGVTGMVDPAGADKDLVGKLCQDRFLLPSEQAAFSACFTNPAGSPTSESHHGLSGVVKGIERHLPRAANKLDRIRSDAALAVIVVTDRAPQSLAKALTADELKSCSLSAASEAKLAAAIQPALDLLSGKGASGGVGTLHVVGGVCANSCGAEVAHGYAELAWQRGGQASDVCTSAPAAALAAIVDDVVGRASTLTLRRTPISASLVVALDGAEVPRSRLQGFSYNAAANSLVFHNVKLKKGSEVVVAFSVWYWVGCC